MNEMAKKKESTPGENLEKQIIEQYNPKSVADMQNALKDIFGPMFEAMLQGEMNSHLGYENNDHGAKSTYACINMGEASCPIEIEQQSICIYADIADAINDLSAK